MRRALAVGALAALLLMPPAAACSVVQGATMQARYVAWNPSSGELVPWPAMRTGFGASCEPSMPRTVFDGSRLVYVHEGRVRVASLDGRVAASHPAEGEALGQDGSDLLLVKTRDATRTLHAFRLDSGAVRDLPWPGAPWWFVADGSRLAWTTDEQPPRLVVHDAITGRTIVQPLALDATRKGAAVQALSSTWAVGFGSPIREHPTLWAHDLQRNRSILLSNGSGESGGFSLPSRFSTADPLGAMHLDGDSLVVVGGPRGEEAAVWRVHLPDSTLDRLGPLPALEGHERMVDAAGGWVVLSTGRLVQGIPALPWAVALAALAALALLARRPVR
jgi:hypothetical protein